VGNREGIEHPRQPPRTAGGNLTDQILSRLLAHPLQGEQVVDRQRVEIGVASDKPGGHELLDELFAESFNLHRTA